MEKLLAASQARGPQGDRRRRAGRRKAGDNPHLWYAPANMKAAAQALDARRSPPPIPPHAADYAANAAAFDAIAASASTTSSPRCASAIKGVAVAASEPVFGYAAEAIGLDVREEKFALAVMNNTEPAPSDVAAFENDLKGHKVRAMLYNAQASEPAVERLVADRQGKAACRSSASPRPSRRTRAIRTG